MNASKISHKELWINTIDQLIGYHKDHPIVNQLYAEKNEQLLKGIKSFFNNYIIKYEIYDYISMFHIADLFKRLASQLPLYEINDIPEEWSPITDISDPEKIVYQAIRCSSLFKTVNIRTGEISYQDINQFEGTYKNRRYVHYHSGLIDGVLSKYYPIIMPYYPGSDNIIVTTEDFLVNPINGDFDTVGILYAEHPYLGIQKINQFFKENSKKPTVWVRITYFEYILRKLLKIDPNSKLAHNIRKRYHKRKKELYGDPMKFSIDPRVANDAISEAMKNVKQYAKDDMLAAEQNFINIEDKKDASKSSPENDPGQAHGDEIL